MFGFSTKQIGITVGVGIISLIILGSLIGGSPKTEQPPISSPPPANQQTPQTISESQPQSAAQTPPPPHQDVALKVTFVVDGDTVELSTGQRVRLIGIDTSERGSPFYTEARDKLIQLVLNKEVRLEKDITETDRYGRLLRYIYVGQMFVNLEMVKLGYANSYTYPPDIKYQDQIVKAEQGARNAKLGLWATQPISPPPTVTSPQPVTTPTPPPTTLTPSPTPTPPSTTTYSVPPCASSDCDCGHFSTHAYAQWFHDNYDPTDKHRLDQDKDGLACESLP